MIDVCFDYAELHNQHGKLIVIIDTLRATTTIITAIGNGAECVVPVESIEEAFKQKALYKGAILGGERNGVKINGFEAGNSPLEYSKDIVSGKTIILTTTNGTRAIKSAFGSGTIILAALINSGAVANFIRSVKEDIIIVCSGTDGRFTMEDAYTAGCIVFKTDRDDLTDSAHAVKFLYERISQNPELLHKTCAHLKELISKGFLKDIDYSLKEDMTEIVPYYKEGRIIRGL